MSLPRFDTSSLILAELIQAPKRLSRELQPATFGILGRTQTVKLRCCTPGELSLVERLYKAALVDFAQQAIVDEGLRVRCFGLGIILLDKTEHGLDAAQRRIRCRLVVFRDQ